MMIFFSLVIVALITLPVVIAVLAWRNAMARLDEDRALHDEIAIFQIQREFRLRDNRILRRGE